MRSRVIEQHKESLSLTLEQREALVGLILGDACLESQNGGRTYRLKIEQSAQHEAYVRHLHELFGSWVLSEPHQKVKTASNGTQTTSWAFNTVSHQAFRFYAHQFYDGRKKRVPELIHRWLTPRSLSYWYMDDGSLKSNQSKGVVLNTQGFEQSGVMRLIEALKQQFQLEAKLRKQTDGFQIYVSGVSFEILDSLIGPFLIDSMRYKFPQKRRT